MLRAPSRGRGWITISEHQPRSTGAPVGLLPGWGERGGAEKSWGSFSCHEKGQREVRSHRRGQCAGPPVGRHGRVPGRCKAERQGEGGISRREGSPFLIRIWGESGWIRRGETGPWAPDHGPLRKWDTKMCSISTSTAPTSFREEEGGRREQSGELELIRGKLA